MVLALDTLGLLTGAGNGCVVYSGQEFGKSAEANARRLMDRKMVHFVASDAHDTR